MQAAGRRRPRAPAPPMHNACIAGRLQSQRVGTGTQQRWWWWWRVAGQERIGLPMSHIYTAPSLPAAACHAMHAARPACDHAPSPPPDDSQARFPGTARTAPHPTSIRALPTDAACVRNRCAHHLYSTSSPQRSGGAWLFAALLPPACHSSPPTRLRLCPCRPPCRPGLAATSSRLSHDDLRPARGARARRGTPPP